MILQTIDLADSGAQEFYDVPDEVLAPVVEEFGTILEDPCELLGEERLDAIYEIGKWLDHSAAPDCTFYLV